MSIAGGKRSNLSRLMTLTRFEMEIYLSSIYIKAHRKLVKRNPRMRAKLKKQLGLFLKNPNHPSLRLHKFQGITKPSWSISVDKEVRLIFVYVGDGILLVNIGSHDEVY